MISLTGCLRVAVWVVPTPGLFQQCCASLAPVQRCLFRTQPRVPLFLLSASGSCGSCVPSTVFPRLLRTGFGAGPLSSFQRLPCLLTALLLLNRFSRV